MNTSIEDGQVTTDRRSSWQRRYDESVRAENARLDAMVPGPRWAWALTHMPILERFAWRAIWRDYERRENSPGPKPQQPPEGG